MIVLRYFDTANFYFIKLNRTKTQIKSKKKQKKALINQRFSKNNRVT
ncbi:hypothetical protein PULV_b0777 [Pseudoalteromonas ulvae UL12]|nr:hypothetical protein [Pseudoalteromonas ulvae UL12]